MKNTRLRPAFHAVLLASLAMPAFAQDAKPGTTHPAPTQDVGAPAAPAATAPAAPAKSLPDAREILAKSVTAIGGREAWEKIKSVEIKGSMSMPAANIKGPMTSQVSSPNKMLTVIELAGVGTIRQGFDGTTAWSVDPISGPRLLEGKELETMTREADFLKDVDPAKRWDKVETVGEGDFGGFDCWKLEATKDGSTSTHWYEKSTGLPRGFSAEIDTQLGRIPVTTVMVEYKEFTGAGFGSVQFPARTETTQMNQKMISLIESITFDAVPAEAFALPKEIAALLEPEPSEEGDDAEAAPAPASSAPKQDAPKPDAPAAPKA
jgi:hypothetical protein